MRLHTRTANIRKDSLHVVLLLFLCLLVYKAQKKMDRDLNVAVDPNLYKEECTGSSPVIDACGDRGPATMG